jgi:uncharacterized membrane protein YuzA (DUF378 family)
MAEKLFGDNMMVLYAVWLLVGLAALNWGLVEFADTNLLADTLGLSNDLLTGAYAVIGAAGAVSLYNTIMVDIMED